MIKSKEDLRLCLMEDLKALGSRHRYFKPQYFWSLWLFSENAFLWHYLKHLRYAEYYTNVNKFKWGGGNATMARMA